ncbi:uncharacterized protein [Diabrotica undecimpunctata]|uniref:uncharacterized protein isoform X1 n=1 Tax=Diabrotica undecimpunctata TaxID=50387 RepID=UPI003B631B85
MSLHRDLLVLHVLLASFIQFSTSRAVNISNTWVLPEEGFPVFYRYFRDRISWYEADAVCQFHHSYLVTADSSSQYDAIRAYLKELDITDNVWIGLSKNAEKPNFMWTNSLQPLSGEGHWQESIPISKNSLCVAMDPAKDFLWKSLTCGGPEVASFICEMPIPSWAMGPKGCLLTELPSLTVLYIPEQSSLELTSDCGLDGTKRIACKGNADREEILKQLTCAIFNEDFEDKSTKSLLTTPTISYTQSDSKTTKIWTSNTIDVDYGMPTRHRRETEDTLSASSTESTGKITPTLEISTAATTYDTEVTTNAVSRPTSSLVPIVMNRATQNIPTTSTSTKTKVAVAPTSTIGRSKFLTTTDNVTPIIETAQTSTTVGSITSTTDARAIKSTPNSVDKDIVIEYPSAISQGQLFSIIENGTMFDIIELNETSDSRPIQTQEVINAEAKTSKPSNKLLQLDEKNSKNPADPKTKPLTKKDIYKNADPKKKNAQKNSDDKIVKVLEAKEISTGSPIKEFLQKREEKETVAPITEAKKIDKAALKIIHVEENKEPTETQKVTEKTEDVKEAESKELVESKEELDLNKQVEILPIKQITDEITVQKHEKDIEMNLSKEENKEVESKENYNNNNKESMEEMDLNKEIEIFPVIHDKSPHLNRTFRKELPMMADEPSFDETKEVGDNRLELMDIDELGPRSDDTNDTKIDPNIDLLNKNITKNNDSELISHIDKDVLKKQLLPKPLQGQIENPIVKEEKLTEQKSIKKEEKQQDFVKTDTSTEEISESEENSDHPRPNRQRQLTRPHGRPFYPNFFSRVLG